MNQSDKVEKLFGSHSRTAIVKYFLQNPEKKLRISEIANNTNIDKRLVSTEIKRLVAIGLISSEKLGEVNFFLLNQTSNMSSPLKELFTEHVWYEWERPSRIHHLILTMEAGLQPMQDYYGFCLPECYNVFDYDNVTIFFNINEFRSVGKKLLPIYQKRKKQIWNDFYRYASTLSKHKDYLSFYKNYINFWKVAYITEPISFYIDSLLKSNEQITIKKKSFTEEYEDELWKLVEEARKIGINKIDVTNIIKNYFWIRNSYYGVHYLTEEEIRAEVRARMEKTKPQQNPNIKMPFLPKELIEIGQDIVFMQDERKKIMMQAAYYLHQYLKKTAKTWNIPLLSVEQSVPQEIIKNKKLVSSLKDELNLRLRSCTIITGITGGVRVFSGQLIYPTGAKNTTELEVRGNVACGGKAIGRAKIVMNIDEIYKVNHGDVIISTMTSPELMSAVRRCVAIVTDFGGIACHAAIVAREFNLPCIVGTNDATKKIYDNDLVEVDANNGVVRVLER